MINFFIYHFLIYNAFSYIIKLKFQSLPKSYSDNLESNFIQLYEENLITNLTIGTPPKTIKSIILFTLYEYFIVDNKSNHIFYSKDSSKSFYSDSKYPEEYFETLFQYGFYSKETFIFNNVTNNEINIEKLSTIIAVNTKLKYPSYLGLNFFDGSEDLKISFLEALYYNKDITQKVFSIEFLNEKEGEIILGDLPHNYNKEIYDENDLKWNNIGIELGYMYWNIYFDKILFDDEKYEGKSYCYLEYELNVIYAPKEYKNKLDKTFFLNNKNKCKENFYITNIEKKNLSYIVCDKELNYKSFPKIIFKSNEYNYDFVLDFKDLFIEINGKMYFLVVFEQSIKFYRWRVGIPFIKNHLFVFDQDKKSIGIYIKKKIKKRFPINLIILSVIIIILVILIVYNIRKIKRKKRINEIDDEYNYIPEKII